MVDAFSTAFSNILLRVSLPAAASCLVLVGLGAAWLMLQNVSRRIRRAFGVVTLMFLGLWVLAMGGSGSYPTRDEKEQNRALQAEIAAERAAIASLMLAGGTPRQQSGYGPMQSIPSWEHGIYEDGARIVFPDGWVYPFGSNHLASVEVMPWGAVFPDGFSRSQVAAFGPRLSMVPGVSSFHYGMTSSNSCAFEWSSARDGRINGEPFDGRIELFRNGDVSVTTNDIAAFLPRTLPFSHDGFGQDAEWVTANFTNATEILAVGYPQWVDAQVGEGLTNGLYKLSVTVADDPPETTCITVGDLSVAVTNAGEYVFLMEKGPAYDLTVFPPSSNVTISAVDDVPTMRRTPMMRSAWSWGDGTWSVDMGEFVCNYAPGMPSAVCWWLPWLCGSPDVVHIGPSDPQMEFVAWIFDCVHPENATFEWDVGEGLVAATPYAQSTLVTAVDIPSWSSVSMSVTAWFESVRSLVSSTGVTVGTNSTPWAGISLSVPRVMFQNDDDDNYDGIVDYEMVNFGNVLTNAEDDVVKGGVVFRSDVLTNGTVRIELSGFPGDVYTNDCEAALVSESFDVAIEGEVSRTVDLYFNPLSWAPYQSPKVTAVWIPEVGEPQTSSVPFSVVKPVAETICSNTVEHSVLGTNHVYTVNPCGVAVGDDAYFSVKVSPSVLPDSDIVWTNYDEHVVFVGGNTGRNVHVRGVSPGDAELKVIIGGRTRQAPAFPLKVVTQQVFKITAWIVEDENKKTARKVEDVFSMVEPLNDIYRQVGVSFCLDSVTVTNIPAAYNLVYDEDPNGGWDFDRLVDIGHGTGGIECYFVNDFIMLEGEKPPLAANTSKGLVMSAMADATTLAHEIGHAFGRDGDRPHGTRVFQGFPRCQPPE